jgi:hypothetical protein
MIVCFNAQSTAHKVTHSCAAMRMPMRDGPHWKADFVHAQYFRILRDLARVTPQNTRPDRRCFGQNKGQASARQTVNNRDITCRMRRRIPIVRDPTDSHLNRDSRGPAMYQAHKHRTLPFLGIL